MGQYRRGTDCLKVKSVAKIFFEMPAIIATPALRPWHGNDERQPQPKRGVAPSLVRNQDRNRLLVRRSDHAPARGDQDLGPRRDRALRAAKHDLAHALRSALALAAAREDRDQSAPVPRSALALVLRSALAPIPRSALGLDAARNRAADKSKRRASKRSKSKRKC